MIALLGLLTTITLAAPTESDAARRTDLAVDGVFSFTNNVGLRPGYGVQVQGSHGWRTYAGSAAVGTFDLGVLSAYHRDPYAPFTRHLGDGRVSGASHRVETNLVVGHTLRLLTSRRLLVSGQLYAGWAQVYMRGKLENPRIGVDGDYSAQKGALVVGGSFAMGVRLTERLTVVSRVRAPIPTTDAPVTSTALFGLGLSARL